MKSQVENQVAQDLYSQVPPRQSQGSLSADPYPESCFSHGFERFGLRSGYFEMQRWSEIVILARGDVGCCLVEDSAAE